MFAEGYINCVSRKTPVFANISLTWNTISDCILDLVADVNGQLKEKVASFEAMSAAMYESTDIADIAQLAIFIRRVGASLTVSEEFVQLVPVTGMIKAEVIFCSLVVALYNVGVDWFCAVSVVTDGAPSTIGKKAGVVAKLKDNVHIANGVLGFRAFHSIIHEDRSEDTVVSCSVLENSHIIQLASLMVNVSFT